jgi:transcriptional regulator with XRE-family HTH domain
MTDEEQKIIFSKNLNRYLKSHNKTQREVANAIGVSPQTFNTWCQGIALPRMGKVQRLADYFSISKSDLIEGNVSDDYADLENKGTVGEKSFNQIFSTNLNHYLGKEQKTQLDLARYVGVSTASVSNWCKGLKTPRMDKIDLICRYFDISRNELLGEGSLERECIDNKGIMAKNIQHYMLQNSVKASDICNALNFPMATFSDWIHAKSYPRIDKIELMANYFGVSKSDLVENHSSQPAFPIIIKYYNRLNEIGKKEATKRVEELTHLSTYTLSANIPDIKEAKPDKRDLEMIAEAEKENDGTTVSLEELLERDGWTYADLQD